MAEQGTVLALVGSYRRGGVTESITDEMLAAAREAGADTQKIFLMNRDIAFCTNCRACTQTAGDGRGVCPLQDGMNDLLAEIDAADALILASPMNFGTVTAVMKRFLERLVSCAYWPWGALAPKIRPRTHDKAAVVVTSSACPALLGRLTTPIVKTLKTAAKLLGAGSIRVFYLGLMGAAERPVLNDRQRRRARRLGTELARQAKLRAAG